ncbi:MAG: hypothetical protein ACLQAT_04015 [Candidatus Binataceae bacterium]
MNQIDPPKIIVARLASALMAIALAALPIALGACAAAALPAASLVQGGVAAMGYTGMQLGAKSADKHTPGTVDDQPERCDALADAPPGVEEVRKDKDDTIETRQWRLINSAKPIWMVVGTRTAPVDGWEPKPSIGRLQFTPPLADQLDYKKSQFLAYAPNDLDNIDDNRVMMIVTEAFGPSQGTFQWRGKTYGYALVDQLPCFPVKK